MNLKKRLLILRRRILSRIVPESYWPPFVDVDGVQIQVRDAPYSFGVKRLLAHSNDYELAERKIVHAILVPGMTVIEMGGSIGILTSVIANLVGPQGRVVSIEASRALVSYSKTWLEKSPHVTVVRGFGFPVWQVPTELRVAGFDDDNGSLGGTVAFRLDEPATPEPGSGDIGAPAGEVWDLSRICDTYALRPDVLVVDIEGSELLMLEAPLEFPSTIQYLLIELHPWLYPDKGSHASRLVETIKAAGFQMQGRDGGVTLFSKSTA